MDGIIKVALILHNWLKMTSSESYTPTGYVDTEDLTTKSIIQGTWRTQNWLPVENKMKVQLESTVVIGCSHVSRQVSTWKELENNSLLER